MSVPPRSNATVAAYHDALLVAQNDMTVINSSWGKERQKLAVYPLDMRAAAVTSSYRFLVQGIGNGGWRIVQ